MTLLFCFLIGLSSACRTSISSSSTRIKVIQNHTHGNSSYQAFNNIYGSVLYEENLSIGGYCVGDCSLFYPIEQPTNKGSLPNIRDCYGKIHACMRIILEDWPYGCQVCSCLCERSHNSKSHKNHKEIVDSFCLDPISVDRGFAATGVRFKKHQNKIHLELQQGKLRNGKIISESVSWKQTSFCENQKKVIDNIEGWFYERMKLVLEDIILPYNAVVTGAIFNESLQGRFLDDQGNIDETRGEFNQKSRCSEGTADLVHVGPKLMPPTAFNGRIVEISESCKHHVTFDATSWDEDQISHVVPFVDLREVVTVPSQPIVGIGWIYRGHPQYSGYVALKIFVRKKVPNKYTRKSLLPDLNLVPYL